MSPDVTYDLIAACGIGAFALAAVTLFIPPRQIQEEPPAPCEPTPPPVEWFACHDLRCGHTSTPHEPTPIGGLVCLHCGTTTPTRTETP